jgi:hypothetical protein
MGLNLGLRQLFEMMDREVYPTGNSTNTAVKDGQFSLFEVPETNEQFVVSSGIIPAETENSVITRLHSDGGLDLSELPANARRLYELSVNAFDAIVHAWMNELPITPEIIRFGKKILAAADLVKTSGSATGELEMAERKAAEIACADRGDSDVRAVLDSAYKVWHEIHRLTGLLRFHPDEGGVYTAHCGPDHFILPALGPHFRDRFGETPWAIIDEKRRLCLRCHSGQQLEFYGMPDSPESPQDGDWGNLWRLYHKTINNESRKNPGLQKQFMPKRYWKYLTEL